MEKKKITELIKRAFYLGSQQGYEIASQTPVNENTGKDELLNIVLETAINSLESTVFKSISDELDLMNEQFPEFNCWKVFSDGVIHGAEKYFSDKTTNKE